MTIAGTDITELGDTELTKLRREHIGFIFQFFNLLPMLTAEENVVLPLKLAGEKPDREWVGELTTQGRSLRAPHAPPVRALGRSAAARRDRARARLAADRHVRRRADGQPRLDDGRRDPRAPPRLGHDLGQTTVMVTHDAHAAAIADRVLFLADGLIVKDIGQSSAARDPRGDGGGEPRDDRRHPARASPGARSAAFLTALAVVLGVAMISGTYVLTDTFQKAFDSIFNESYAGTDAVVSGKQLLDFSSSGRAAVPAGLLDEIRRCRRSRRRPAGSSTSSRTRIRRSSSTRDGKKIGGAAAPTSASASTRASSASPR